MKVKELIKELKDLREVAKREPVEVKKVTTFVPPEMVDHIGGMPYVDLGAGGMHSISGSNSVYEDGKKWFSDRVHIGYRVEHDCAEDLRYNQEIKYAKRDVKNLEEELKEAWIEESFTKWLNKEINK